MKTFRLQLWMLMRYLRERRRFISLNVVLSVLGMSLGVAALVVAMAIVSGYESTLKKVSIDSFGDLILARRGSAIKIDDEFIDKIKKSSPQMTHWTPFLLTEAIFVNKGKISGVIIEGVDSATHSQVLNLKTHLRDGDFRFQHEENAIPQAVIGKVLRQKMGLEIGDEFRLVVPVTDKAGSDNFRPKSLRMKLAGVLSLGRHDFDERYVLVDLKTLQEFTGLKDKVSGLRMKITNSDDAELVAATLSSDFGFPFWTKTWRDANRNLFEAVVYEKPVIFIIVCLIIIAAAFNISTSLYVSVLRRFRDISILKTLGASPRFIRQLFIRQGLLLTAIGSVIGIFLGMLLCRALIILQNYFPLFPGEIYRIDYVQLETRGFDIILIIMVSMMIGYLSTWSPARRGSRLKPVQGLRYE